MIDSFSRIHPKATLQTAGSISVCGNSCCRLIIIWQARYASAALRHIFPPRQALLGAFILYLDIINLFALLLRLTGDRRD
jgi:FtsH-binding integral membrane protein